MAIRDAAMKQEKYYLITIIKNKECDNLRCSRCPLHVEHIRSTVPGLEDIGYDNKGFISCSIQPQKYMYSMKERHERALDIFLSLYSQEELFGILL